MIRKVSSYRAAVTVATLTLLIAASAHSQNAPEVRATPEEQFALARQLQRGTYIYTTEREKHEAVVKTAAALEAVRQKWPHDVRAVLQSAFMEADLFLRMRAPRNAAPLLEWLATYVKGSDNEPFVQRRLGQAYEMMNRREDAAKAFDRAEKHRANEKHPTEAHQTYLASAQFYARTARPNEAAKRYREAARIPAINAAVRANITLLAARAHIDGGDQKEAHRDLDTAARLIEEAKRGTAAGRVNTLEAELRRLSKLAGKG